MKNLVDYIYENGCVSEMATNLSTFRLLLHNLYIQLIENWCLVKCCDMFPNELTSIRLRNYWVTELRTIMCEITNEKLKSGRKDKVIRHELINSIELNDKDRISSLIRDKFCKEGLEQYVNIISIECADNMNNICDILCGSSNDVKNYIDGYIG